MHVTIFFSLFLFVSNFLFSYSDFFLLHVPPLTLSVLSSFSQTITIFSYMIPYLFYLTVFYFLIWLKLLVSLFFYHSYTIFSSMSFIPFCINFLLPHPASSSFPFYLISCLLHNYILLIYSFTTFHLLLHLRIFSPSTSLFFTLHVIQYPLIFPYMKTSKLCLQSRYASHIFTFSSCGSQTLPARYRIGYELMPPRYFKHFGDKTTHTHTHPHTRRAFG